MHTRAMFLGLMLAGCTDGLPDGKPDTGVPDTSFETSFKSVATFSVELSGGSAFAGECEDIDDAVIVACEDQAMTLRCAITQAGFGTYDIQLVLPASITEAREYDMLGFQQGDGLEVVESEEFFYFNHDANTSRVTLTQAEFGAKLVGTFSTEWENLNPDFEDEITVSGGFEMFCR